MKYLIHLYYRDGKFKEFEHNDLPMMWCEAIIPEPSLQPTDPSVWFPGTHNKRVFFKKEEFTHTNWFKRIKVGIYEEGNDERQTVNNNG